MMGHVLVVEDDHAISEVMCDALRAAGYTIDCATNDRAAHDRIMGLPELAALVLDINLGRGTTGYDVARFARQVIQDIPVIYVSGDIAPTTCEIFGVPESTFLEKPFTPAELVEAVKAKLRSKSQLR